MSRVNEKFVQYCYNKQGAAVTHVTEPNHVILTDYKRSKIEIMRRWHR